MNWNAVPEETGGIGYDIFNGSELAGFSLTTSFCVTGLMPLTTYSMTVEARNLADNTPVSSASLTVTTRPGVDWVPPALGGGLYTSQWLESPVTTGDPLTLTPLLPSATTTDSAGGLSTASALLMTDMFSGEQPSTLSGLVLWLKADTEPTGALATWIDQSGLDHHATQPDEAARPEVIADAMNGQPVVRFDGSNDFLELADIMSGITQGEIFIVNRLANFTNQYNGLCQFGVQNGVAYSEDNGDFIWEDFGINDGGAFSGPGSGVLTSTHIYNASITGQAVSTVRFDGRSIKVRTGGQVDFTSAPLIGTDVYNEFYRGDIAEIIVYDHSLTQEERDTVYTYLTLKYAPPGISIPAVPDLTGFPLSSTQADMSWAVSAGADQYFVATVERKVGEGDFAVVATLPNALDYTDAGLAAAATYTYRVKLTSYAGESGYSNEIVITTPSVGTDIPAGGLRLWLRSTAGLPASGKVAKWADQSGLNNHALQEYDDNERPEVIPNAINGRPVVRFNGAQVLRLPDIMSGATAGEIIAVLKVGDKSSGPYEDTNNKLWDFGNSGTGYHPEGAVYFHYNQFGLQNQAQVSEVPVSLVENYHVYSTSSDGLLWSESYNGVVHQTAAEQDVGFTSEPSLGVGVFVGDFAEILVYDRVLTSVERASVRAYLGVKYSINPGEAIPPSTPEALVASDIAAGGFTLSWTASTDNIGVVGYCIYIDGLLHAYVSGPSVTYPVDALDPETTYSVTVVAMDAAGNSSTPSAALDVTTLADTTAPTIPTGLAASEIGSSGFILTWSPSEDDIAVVSYDIYRDGSLAGSTSGTSLAITGLTVNTTYSLTVRACDAAGNTSAQSAALPVTTVPDAQPPTSPTDFEVVRVFSNSVMLHWTASSDNIGVAAYDIHQDGVLIGSSLGGDTTYTALNLTPQTTYSFSVSARDAEGNVSAPTEALMVTTAEMAPLPGLRLWLRADRGVPSSGRVGLWEDQSGLNNHALQEYDDDARPEVIPNAINGHPVVRFSGSQMLYLPDVMAGATAGEIIAVVKVTDKTLGGYDDINNKLWNFNQSGTGYVEGDPGVAYYHYNTFGTDDDGHTSEIPISLVSNYHIFDTCISPELWAEYYNGLLQTSAAGRTATFTSSPNLGAGVFAGDFAEVLVFDRVLTDVERAVVQSWLGSRYAITIVAPPAAPVGVTARVLSRTQVCLSWMGEATGLYTIERKRGDGNYQVIGTTGNGPAYLDTWLESAVEYSYRVKITVNGVSSSYSDPADVTTFSEGDDFPLGNLRTWLKADAGVLSSGSRVSAWLDQSGHGNTAVGNNDSSTHPEIVANSINGLPVIHFDGKHNQILFLPDIMSGAAQGEIIAVTKVLDKSSGAYPDHNNKLWDFGQAGTGYLKSDEAATVYAHYNQFGLTEVQGGEGFPVSQVSDYHVFDTSSDGGLWAERYNGIIYTSVAGRPVAFGSVPNIGAGVFAGDFAEVLIFDRVLTDTERATVQEYLYNKYHLSALLSGLVDSAPDGDVDGDGLTNAQEVDIYHTDPYRRDTDGDGMADGYELAMGLNPLINDAAGDRDGDGVPNFEDARPDDSNIGRLTVGITLPANGETFP